MPSQPRLRQHRSRWRPWPAPFARAGRLPRTPSSSTREGVPGFFFLVHNFVEGFDKGPGVIPLEGVPSHADPATPGFHRVEDCLEGLEVPGFLPASYDHRDRAGRDDALPARRVTGVVGLDEVCTEFFCDPDAVA